jgi:hypothetical protein
MTRPAAELFYDSSEGTEGKATIFLSFAYISDFLSVFRCLQDHYMRAKVEDFEHQYVWISFFSVNQVALPFHKPAPSTRAWCVLEVYTGCGENQQFACLKWQWTRRRQRVVCTVF